MAEHQNLLMLLHSYANERTQGERCVEELKSRNSALSLEIETVRRKIEEAKSKKNDADEHLKDLQTQLVTTEAAVKIRQARVQFQQEEINKAKNEASALEEEQCLLRENFIKEMLAFKERMRDMKQRYNSTAVEHIIHEKSGIGNEDKKFSASNAVAKDLIIIETISQMKKEEEELTEKYHAVLKKKEETEQRLALMENFVQLSEDLRIFSEYPPIPPNII